MQPAPQDNQLMSKHRVLSFKPELRLEWRGQDGQNETEQPDHSASLGDSITSSTRIGFSVHTRGVGPNIKRSSNSLHSSCSRAAASIIRRSSFSLLRSLTTWHLPAILKVSIPAPACGLTPSLDR